ncbi:MAG: FAD-linked oxidase C-terminal domain-containing protein, partial [Myxococcales bacterium]
TYSAVARRADVSRTFPYQNRDAKKLVTTAALGQPIALNHAADLFKECLLVLVFEGPTDLCDLEADEGARICALNGGEDLGPGPGRVWMEKRYAVSYKQSKVFDLGAFADTMEVAGPWDQVVDIYERVKAAVAEHAFVMCHFSHAYVEGCCLYFSFAGAGGTLEETEARYDRLWKEALRAAQEAGANVSHHHGVGFSKADALVRQLGDGGMRVLRALKQTWDPAGILNPGKLGLS